MTVEQIKEETDTKVKEIATKVAKQITIDIE